jgi:RNA polymerase sigma-70 factor (ECF subfamily)
VYLDSAIPEPALPLSMIQTAPRLSFEELYDQNVDFVWRVLARLGVRSESVEDVAQEVFVVVHRKLWEFEGASSIRTWLFHIARRAVQEHRRVVRRKEPPAGSSEANDAATLDHLPGNTEASPDVLAERAQAVQLLHTILGDMDDQKREVFVMVELEQLPAPEIADALGLNVNTVYSRLRLARAAFHEALARHEAQARSRRPR